MLAIAEPDLLLFSQGKFFGAQAGALVAAIAHRLLTRKPTGTPEVVSSFEFKANRGLIVDFGKVAHTGMLQVLREGFKE